MHLPQSLPFTSLRIPQGEEVLWYGYNPTFHRFLDYGLVLTSRTIYMCRRSWWRIARWGEIPLADVVAVALIEDHARPGLRIERTNSAINFHTPFDFYSDEMTFDSSVLEKGVAAIRAELSTLAARE